jgi:hypothetical protein
MSSPAKVLVLLLAALLLAACTAAGDGEAPATLPKDNSEGDKVSETMSASGSEGETPSEGQTAPIETKTATFALG